MSPITDNHTIEKPAIPQTDGLIIIILYLAFYLYLAINLIWHERLYVPYSGVILRGSFLLAIAYNCISVWKIPLIAAFGKLLPEKRHIVFLLILFLIVLSVHIVGRAVDYNISLGPINIHFYGGNYRNSFSLKNIVDICLIAPINEELFFRGFVISSLSQCLDKKYTVFISTFIFGVVHPPASFFGIMILGCIDGLAFVRTRAILPSIFLHMFWNGLNFLPF